MELKRVNTVYFSPTQTTQKVVEAVANGTKLETAAYNFTRLTNIPHIPAFQSDELVIIGAPVYVGRVPKVILPVLETLKGHNTPCILIGVYGNRHFDDYLVELEDMMAAQGFIPVAAAVFLGTHSFSDDLAPNRPNDRDLNLAQKLGGNVVKKLKTAKKPVALSKGVVPGGRPYRQPFRSDLPKPKPYCPVVNNNCISCGACAKTCPTGAIDQKNAENIDPGKCIKCRACARTCPAKAIDFENEGFWAHTKELLDNFGDIYREPKIVI